MIYYSFLIVIKLKDDLEKKFQISSSSLFSIFSMDCSSFSSSSPVSKSLIRTVPLFSAVSKLVWNFFASNFRNLQKSGFAYEVGCCSFIIFLRR